MSAEEEIKKRCTKCRKEKPLIDFHKATKKSYGVDCYCKKCRARVSKRWERKNKKHRREMQVARWNCVKDVENTKRREAWKFIKDDMNAKRRKPGRGPK